MTCHSQLLACSDRVTSSPAPQEAEVFEGATASRREAPAPLCMGFVAALGTWLVRPHHPGASLDAAVTSAMPCVGVSLLSGF